LEWFLPGGGIALEDGGDNFLFVLAEIFEERLGGVFWKDKKALVVDREVATAGFDRVDQFRNAKRHGNGL
jgi:hypothetical protein